MNNCPNDWKCNQCHKSGHKQSECDEPFSDTNQDDTDSTKKDEDKSDTVSDSETENDEGVSSETKTETSDKQFQHSQDTLTNQLQIRLPHQQQETLITEHPQEMISQTSQSALQPSASSIVEDSDTDEAKSLKKPKPKSKSGKKDKTANQNRSDDENQNTNRTNQSSMHKFLVEKLPDASTPSNKTTKRSATTPTTDLFDLSPTVSINYKNYYPTIGRPFTIPCTIGDSNIVQWERVFSTGTQVINLALSKYTGGTKKSPFLTITNIISSDAGDYQCCGTNDYGGSCDKTTLIPGNKPALSRNNENVIAKISDNVVLGVTITSSTPALLSVYWYKSSQRISGIRYHGGTTSIPSLTINNVAVTDDGTYTCSISNGVGTASIDMNLFTWNTPSVSLSGNQNLAVGSKAVIQGTVTSKPEVRSITWTKDTVPITFSDNTKYQTSGSLTNPQLKIYDVQEADKGTYSCAAYNGYDTGTSTVVINVGEITKATILNEYYVTKFGEEITLECLIKNESSNTNLYWLKDDRNVNLNSVNKFSHGTLLQPSLTIRNVDTNDAGKYTCKLENLFKNSEDDVQLKVLYVHVYQPKTLSPKANESVTLSCFAFGGNSVTWWRNGQKITTANKFEYSGGTVSNPSLTISKVTRYHSGNYTCGTSYGNVSATSDSQLQLIVKDIPLVLQRSNNIQASTGDVIQLKCNHESYPEPTLVFWNKDGENLNVSVSKYNGSTINEPSLTIFNTDQLDAGAYVCALVNDIGTGYSSKIQLIIKDPEKTNGALASVVGGVIGAIIVLVAVFIIFIVFRRRRNVHRKDTKRQKVNTKHIKAEQDVHYRPETKAHGEMYMNIGRVSSTDTEEEEAPSSILMKPNPHKAGTTNSSNKRKLNFANENQSTKQNDITHTTPLDRSLGNGNDDSTYYNIDDIITSIRVSELKDYIFKRKSNVNVKLEDEYKKIPYGVQHPTTKAQLKENLPKNRFKTTFPYDHTRVVLELDHGMSSDYINANYVDGFEKEKCYIASQGPVKHTINDHWRMIWQNNTRKIIMLTNLVEGPKRKCERYWPDGGKPITYGNLVLTLLTEKERAAYITREIEVEDKKTKEKRCIIQYHFTAWPDHGTPDPLYLVLFHKHVISDHTSTEKNGPLLVHCSAGIGRTGTYIGLDALHEEGSATGFVDVVKFVKKMRYSRMNMVQTPEQYVCLHYALLEAFTMKDTNVGKEEFGTIWQEIVLDKGPVNRQRLHEEFKMLEAKKSEHDKAQYVAAKSPENVKKNRNKSIIPTDNNRLFLTSYEKGRTDYINAVQAPSYTKFVGYLTTQLPLPDTKVDFWTMVRDHNSSTIVVFLNDPAEADLVYSTSKDSFTCGKYSLTITNRGKEDMDVTSCKVILSKKDDKAREIALYLAVTKGLPDPQVLCKLVNLISTRVSMSNDPVTVVSGDGAKNCGVFCTFANAVSSVTIDNNANIFQLARMLQLRRPEFFSDFNEYRLCYEALNLYLESSSVYANF
ncbi:Tyrosine-protein phosphatase non-receptor type 11,Tyrosine-protein phosphatase non-receptor type 13,Tyrosine-protein phosphatase corkscrew,Tyrosine-protein phosphatase non-receptor type 6 [Mytilus coruscus]|uniref:protein-tyrosine-phosphatase n=1 Tax=Mytilus coruscus TaxID=42192 RepID=A0A6J8B4V8_MYTCO|nr:Tyrosine-protein phosphatase non-receptor type 11,Tyrosine-protein phosphatase non-receptor type 13,Tyrosine-protein phosphatase corkscrew,Tyrosine-protein phosphatase non-receptor type 6 [Mytilus coruscus]